MTCQRCEGRGRFERVGDDKIVECPNCEGRGKMPDCPECEEPVWTCQGLEPPRQWVCGNCRTHVSLEEE